MSQDIKELRETLNDGQTATQLCLMWERNMCLQQVNQ